MPTVLACIDRSSYAASVCDHAAWLAGPINADLVVLHVEEHPVALHPGSGRRDGAEATVATAVERLRDAGAHVEGRIIEGRFPDVAAALDADLIVMGKRGSGTEGDPQGLGSRVEAMIRATETPLCFTSKVYLPVHRALALLDADLAHRRSVEVMRAHPGLRDLESDLVVIADDASPGVFKRTLVMVPPYWVP